CCLGLLCGQTPVDLVPGSRYLDELGHVALNDLLAHGRFQRVPEHGVDRLNHPGGQPRLAARAARLGAAARFFALRVPAVLAALAFLPRTSDEGADIPSRQFGELFPAEAGDQVEPDHALIPLVGLGTPVLTHDLPEPVAQVVRDGPVHRGDGRSLISPAY